MVGTFRGEYSQICTIDLNVPYTFPIITAPDGGDASHNTNNTNNHVSTASPTTLEDSTTVLYRCICPHPEMTDARTTQSYCPSGFACGIPRFDHHYHHHDNPSSSDITTWAPSVDCVRLGDDGPMNSVLRMAWPVSLALFAFLLFWLCGTMYGKALYLFLYKAYLKSTLGKGGERRGLDDNNDNNNNNGDGNSSNIIVTTTNINSTSNDRREPDLEESSPPSLSPLEELERAEVQSLLDWAAGTTATTATATATAAVPLSSTSDSATWWTSTTFRPPQPPPNQWWSIPQQKEYLYKLTIMECARKKWRQERKEIDPSPPPLCLPVKQYDSPNETNDEHDDEQEGPQAVKRMTMTGTVNHAHSHSENVTEEDTDDDDDECSATGPTCSICLVDVVHGDKIGDLKCGHVFHSDCLKAWLTTGRSNNCPLCHAPRIATRRPPPTTTPPAAVSKPTRRTGRTNRLLSSNITPSLSMMRVAPTRTTRTGTMSTTTDESSSVQNPDADQDHDHDHSHHNVRESDAETLFRIPNEGTVTQ